MLNGYAQDDLIKEATYQFVSDGNKLIGAETLRVRIAQSQFFMIGEEHYLVDLAVRHFGFFFPGDINRQPFSFNTAGTGLLR